MPHVVVKLWPGKSEEQIQELTGRIVKDVAETLGYGDESVSVAFEEVGPSDWKEKVYEPDVVMTKNRVTKKPGYRM